MAHESNLQIQAEKNLNKKIQEEKEIMHRKVVKYQDLVYGMVQAILDLSGEFKFLTESQIQKIVEKSTTENLKLSMGVEKIDELVSALESIDLKEKLKEFRKNRSKLE